MNMEPGVTSWHKWVVEGFAVLVGAVGLILILWSVDAAANQEQPPEIVSIGMNIYTVIGSAVVILMILFVIVRSLRRRRRRQPRVLEDPPQHPLAPCPDIDWDHKGNYDDPLHVPWRDGKLKGRKLREDRRHPLPKKVTDRHKAAVARRKTDKLRDETGWTGQAMPEA